MEQRRVHVKDLADVIVVTMLDESIPFEIVDEVGEELRALLESKDPPQRMLLDFRNVTSCASAFLGKLLTLQRECEEDAGKIVVCSLHPPLKKIFKETKVDETISVTRDAASGVEIFDKLLARDLRKLVAKAIKDIRKAVTRAERIANLPFNRNSTTSLKVIEDQIRHCYDLIRSNIDRLE